MNPISPQFFNVFFVPMMHPLYYEQILDLQFKSLELFLVSKNFLVKFLIDLRPLNNFNTKLIFDRQSLLCRAVFAVERLTRLTKPVWKSC